MNHKKNIIKTLGHLGVFLGQFISVEPKKSKEALRNDLFFDGFKQQLKLAQEYNGWFTKANLVFAIQQWYNLLQDKILEQWLSAYRLPVQHPKKVAIIMAGNIPLVGFHDFISALVSGHNIVIKQSSNDRHLLPYLVSYVQHLAPNIKGKIKFTNNKN